MEAPLHKWKRCRVSIGWLLSSECYTAHGTPKAVWTLYAHCNPGTDNMLETNTTRCARLALENVGLLLWRAGFKADVASVEGLHPIEMQPPSLINHGHQRKASPHSVCYIPRRLKEYTRRWNRAYSSSVAKNLHSKCLQNTASSFSNS